MICSGCVHQGTCEGYGELIRCHYNYPDRRFEERIDHEQKV